MTRTLPLLAAIAVVVSSTVAQGLWAHRWTASQALEAAVAPLDRVALNLGDWEGQDQELDRRQLEAGEIAGHLMRRYKNRRDGSMVSILLVCGRAGPICVHTPDICYEGTGYELAADPARTVVPPETAGPPAEFLRGDFRKQNAVVPKGLRIYWAWSTGRAWTAPSSPRLAFAGTPALYKLYVVRDAISADEPIEGDPALEFIRRQLLPELERALSPGESATTDSAGGLRKAP